LDVGELAGDVTFRVAIGVVLLARITADLPADVRETVPEGAARAPQRTLAPTG